MVKAGEITPQEAGTHPHRNVLTPPVGTEPEVDVDVEDVPLIDGDRLLLCSDGLTGMVTEPQIQAILEAAPDPKTPPTDSSRPPTAPAASTTSRWSSSTSTKVMTGASSTVEEGGGVAGADPEERSREAASTTMVGRSDVAAPHRRPARSGRSEPAW
jgi:hypothetical protein